MRVVQGGLLFGAYALDSTAVIVIVMATMLLTCFSERCNPLYRIGLLIQGSKPTATGGCYIDHRAERFSCALGLCVAGTGLVLIFLGWAVVGWPLVLLVGSLSVLAGTVGLCLGTVVHATVFKRHGDGTR